MSNRAIRKIHGAKDDLSTLASSLQLEEDEADDAPANRNENRNQKKKPAINMFDLVCIIYFYLVSLVDQSDFFFLIS